MIEICWDILISLGILLFKFENSPCFDTEMVKEHLEEIFMKIEI